MGGRERGRREREGGREREDKDKEREIKRKKGKRRTIILVYSFVVTIHKNTMPTDTHITNVALCHNQIKEYYCNTVYAHSNVHVHVYQDHTYMYIIYTLSVAIYVLYVVLIIKSKQNKYIYSSFVILI